MKIIQIVSIFLIVISCNENKDILSPELKTQSNWVEIIRIDSIGRENILGEYLIKNEIEFYDSTYKFSSHRISELDSTIIGDTTFRSFHEGKLLIINEIYYLYSSDKEHLSQFQAEILADTLWMGAISECSKNDNANTYWCRTPRDGSYTDSFIWSKFFNKREAKFNKCL